MSELVRNFSDIYAYTCCIGDNDTFGKRFYFVPHGGRDFYVDETLLHFHGGLAAAEDKFKKTPSMERLHGRYGAFSEENVVTSQQREEGIEAVYRGKNYLDVENTYALEIIIYEKGKTIVKLRNPFFEQLKLNKNQKNNWVCYAAMTIDYEFKNRNERIDFTFLNQNNDGKWLFLGYSKSLENPNTSYVRSGICWGDNTSNVYDIRGDKGVLSKKYSNEKWKCSYNNEEYNFTYNTAEGSREVLELIVGSEKLLVRSDNVISEFAGNGEQLLQKMAEFGITWEEIDAAMANEEF